LTPNPHDAYQRDFQTRSGGSVCLGKACATGAHCQVLVAPHFPVRFFAFLKISATFQIR
jgi:hypothetical protein